MYKKGEIRKTKQLVNNKVMNYKIKFRYFWAYAATLEEAEKLSAEAKKTWND